MVRDKLFFFGAYEGNYQNRQGVTRFNGDPTTWPPDVAALQGEAHTSPFRSTLGFAKLSFNQSQKSQFELTGNLRRETDKRRFGGQFGDVFRAFEAGENLRNNVFDAGLKHTFFGQDWINEALVSYQWYQFNPEPFNFDLPAQDLGWHRPDRGGRLSPGSDPEAPVDPERLDLFRSPGRRLPRDQARRQPGFSAIQYE